MCQSKLIFEVKGCMREINLQKNKILPQEISETRFYFIYFAPSPQTISSSDTKKNPGHIFFNSLCNIYLKQLYILECVLL